MSNTVGATGYEHLIILPEARGLMAAQTEHVFLFPKFLLRPGYTLLTHGCVLVLISTTSELRGQPSSWY